jgi:hypothetical protein
MAWALCLEKVACWRPALFRNQSSGAYCEGQSLAAPYYRKCVTDKALQLGIVDWLRRSG